MKIKNFFSQIIILLILLSPVKSTTLSEFEITKQLIWNKEIKIYKSRAESGLNYYINNTSQNYIGWPPGLEKPMGYDQLKLNQTKITFPNSEKIQLFFDNIVIEDNTAIIYYHTHRTVLPNGNKVNQRYHICHVWSKNKKNEWKLLGAMGRLVNSS
ncbi:MAG: hypothetical protein CBC47_04390 [Alphaproteobacteria bacterium TMED87]|nr:hypothetical protein [Rhodospirillaceae bacterium]OUV09805.1 MAG: hypothetical protein CBC47_04390 [Alphaproteobacteria bacterium TMED87]|tara:strand:- start:197 stop:664 length:468 start_codon:yes stop_codon:yes gene_type:complete